jgi:hypothetical protein
LRDPQPQIGIEGRIEEHQIERGAGAWPRGSKPSQSVCPDHLNL